MTLKRLILKEETVEEDPEVEEAEVVEEDLADEVKVAGEIKVDTVAEITEVDMAATEVEYFIEIDVI